MFDIKIPGYRDLQLNQLVLDFNGTIACDGKLIGGLAEKLEILSEQLSIHVITADTHGFAAEQLEHLPCTLKILSDGQQEEAKASFVNNLGANQVVAIGNGRNDRKMLQVAEIGIAVISPEAVAVDTLLTADIITSDIISALDLLLKPLRLVATLRS
jgi:soluble P-type ATPase